MTKIFAVIAILLSGIFVKHDQVIQKPTVVLNNKTFYVEIADTEAKREKGLSTHAPLADNQGMLFVFDKQDKYGFWMKDMTFSLDIVWISSDFKAVYIEKNLSPQTFPKIYYPESPAKYVLEVNSGQNVKLGDLARFYNVF